MAPIWGGGGRADSKEYFARADGVGWVGASAWSLLGGFTAPSQVLGLSPLPAPPNSTHTRVHIACMHVRRWVVLGRCVHAELRLHSSSLLTTVHSWKKMQQATRGIATLPLEHSHRMVSRKCCGDMYCIRLSTATTAAPAAEQRQQEQLRTVSWSNDRIQFLWRHVSHWLMPLAVSPHVICCRRLPSTRNGLQGEGT